MVIASLLPQLTLVAEATIACRLVKLLLNEAFRQVVPSQILFYIPPGFFEIY
jgi:AAA+ superfamily predicted ATPase